MRSVDQKTKLLLLLNVEIRADGYEHQRSRFLFGPLVTRDAGDKLTLALQEKN